MSGAAVIPLLRRLSDRALSGQHQRFWRLMTGKVPAYDCQRSDASRALAAVDDEIVRRDAIRQDGAEPGPGAA